MRPTVSRIRVIVSGRVQGVWFRQSTNATAEELGVSGWVRNRPDGSVEAVFEGDEIAVAKAVAWAHDGPTNALVMEVREFAETPEGLAGFEVRSS